MSNPAHENGTKSAPSGFLLVGVTGSIGSGKSLVAEALAGFLDLVRIDADAVCRELLQPGQSGLQLLHRELPPEYFMKDGSLRRRDLRRAIADDAVLRNRVNRLLHPVARACVMQRVAAHRAGAGCRGAVVEVPLLFEAAWQDDFPVTVLVYADRKTSLGRVASRDGVDVAEAAKLYDAQLDPSEKALLADHVIDNSGSVADTELQVRRLADILLAADQPGKKA